MKAQLLATALLLAGASARVDAASNISPANQFSYGANVGWMEWHPSDADGVSLGSLFLSGKVWSANCGWINLGSGVPANGYRYANNSATDFGVNLNPDGTLDGYAYGANIGWIRFTRQTAGAAVPDTQIPRVDLKTGRFSGYAYGANIGWIDLGGAAGYVKATTIDVGADTDGDTIPDAWELQYAGNLSKLTKDGDFDGDGVPDVEEYLADTDPTNPNDFLQITHVTATSDGSVVSLTWNSRPSRCYRIQSRAEVADGGWVDNNPPGLFSPDTGVSTTRKLIQSPAAHGFYRVESFPPAANFGP
jgi:hypothetical protein